MNAAERQQQLIARKALLGDQDAARISEEHGRPTADALAVNAAGNAGLCACRRSDGVVCGRSLAASRGGLAWKPPPPLCWPCWSRARDGKPCSHAVEGAQLSEDTNG